MTAAATFCATLVDEWIRRGLRHAVIAPGSRSTPVVLALADRPEMSLHVVHDERSAAFVALGLGLDGVPTALVCTSGTAAANFHPAVVEAGLSDVPMLVLTADRPPEMRGVGAPQAIDQLQLYGRAVRWFADAPVPDDAGAAEWRPLARAAILAASSGPAHLNLPFREPLLGMPAALPQLASDESDPSDQSGGSDGPGGPGESNADRPTAVAPSPELLRRLDSRRGLIIAGGRSGAGLDDIAALAAATGWPVIAGPTSGARHLDGVVTTFDALVRHQRFAADHRPEVVVRIGRPMLSRVFNEWLAAAGPLLVQVGGPGVIDPDHQVDTRLEVGALRALAVGLQGAADTPWRARWNDAERRAQAAIEAVLAGQQALCEPAVARAIAEHRPAACDVVVAASMPMRDLEWYGGRRAVAHANRGANGIDGVLSTALGRALGGRAVIALVGDIAFLHDSNALIGLARREADLRIVVVDNDGGGIFSFLPQASALAPARFEMLFGTPHGADVLAIAAAHGVPGRTVAALGDLVSAITMPGPSVTRIATDRADNVAIHRALNDAVANALDDR